MVRRVMIWVVVILFVVALVMMVYGSIDVSARAIGGVLQVGALMGGEG